MYTSRFWQEDFGLSFKRLTIWIPFLLVLIACATLPASADTIASNFGPGGTYGPGEYLLQGNPLPGMNVAQSFAIPFTPSESATSWDVVFPLQALFGPPLITVDIASDSSGMPGPFLTTLAQNGSIPAASAGLVTFSCSACPTLQSGTPYWIVTGAPYGNTFVFWYWSSTELGNYDFNNTGSVNGPWYPSIYNTPVFKVDSTAVPEPASLLLAGSAILGVAFRLILKRRT